MRLLHYVRNDDFLDSFWEIGKIVGTGFSPYYPDNSDMLYIMDASLGKHL